MKRNEESLLDLLETIKISNVLLTGGPEGAKEEKGVESLLK